MAQEYIDFGSFPDDPTADAIRTAFQKAQNNFTELFLAQTNSGVASLNQTAGAGVTVNQPIGNVILTANIACVQVSTSTLSIGRDGNGGTSATITQSSQTLVVDLPSSLVTENITANGNLTVQGTANLVGNVTIGGQINLSGNLSVNNITATNTVSANFFTGVITTNNQPNITSVGSLSNLTVLGNTVSSNFTGTFANGNSNINIPAANGNINLSVSGNSNIVVVSGTGITVNGNLDSSNANLGNTATANFFTGTLTTSAQPNITSVGTLANLNVSGNSNLGNTATANFFTGTLTTSAQPNITSVGTLSTLTVLGNLVSGNAALGNAAAANFFIGDGGLLSNVIVAANSQIINGNSNVRIYGSGGEVTVSVNGSPNVFVVGNNQANFSINVNVNANISTNNITATNNANANVVHANTVNASSIIGTLNTSSQPNITSLGNLTGLTVTGTSNLGPASNITITGGLNNYYLTTNGSGGLSWTSGSFSPPGGSNGDIQINNQGNLGAATGLTWNLTSNTLTASNGTIVANSFVGNFVQGTLTTAAQPNITSVGSLTYLIVTGNINSANVSGGNLVQANYLQGTLTTGSQPNITSVGTLGSLTVTGNISGGNISTTGITNTGRLNVTANGANITGNSSITGNLDISGNINVTGNLNYENVTDLVVGDPLIFIGANNVGNLVDLGLVVSWNDGNYQHGGLVRDHTSGIWRFFSNVIPDPTTVIDWTNAIAAPVQTGNLISTNANLGNNATANYFTGTLTTNAQPNITSVGTLTNLNVTGNISSGNANLGNLATANFFTGTLTTNAQPNITSVGTLTSLTVTGNVTSGNVIANNISANTFVGAFSGEATTAATVTTNAQPNITSVGTLTSLGVNGTITAANITANTGVFTGNGSALSAINASNISTGTLSQSRLANSSVTLGNTLLTLGDTVTTIAGLSSVTSTTFVGAFSGAATTAATVTTNAQPNITSVGTLSSLSVTGNVSAGNLTTTGVLSVTGTGVSSIAGNLDMTSNTIINLASPTNPNDAATKQYVDDVAQGLNIHDAVAAATPITLASISGGIVTYNNGLSGVGANLTTTGSINLIDGVNVQTSGTRILVKNEANAVHNGIYTWSNSTVLTRATDYDSVPEVEAGDFVFCSDGTLYGGTGWVQSDSPASIGGAGDTINFIQFSGAGTYDAGTGLTLTGTTFSVNASQTQITSVGTLSSLSVTGNISSGNANLGNLVSANFFTGALTTNAQPNITSVGTLTSLAVTGNITSGNANLGNLATANYFTGTLTTNAQPNITSVGTLTSLNVTGNVTASYFFGNGSQLTGLTAGNISGTVANANYAAYAGNVTTAAQPNITSVGTLSSLAVTGTTTSGNFATAGNITASFLISNVATGTAPLTVTSTTKVTNLNADTVDGYDTATAATANTIAVRDTNGSLTANVFIGSGANLTNIPSGNISGTVANANYAAYAGNVTIAAQPNITSVGTLTSLAVTGNISAGNVSATTFTGALSGAATTAGTVTTNAQPNITSVGTLSSLAVTGNITSGNANVGNLGVAGTSNFIGTITGSNALTITNDIIYQSSLNAVGTYYFQARRTRGTVSSPTTVISGDTVGGFLGGGYDGTAYRYSGSIEFYVDGAVSSGVVPMGIRLMTGPSSTFTERVRIDSTGLVSVVGNLIAANISTGGLITATGNITGGNIVTGGLITATGNITSGNANLGNLVSANFFTGNGSQLTGLTAGNISGTVANANYAAYAGNVTIAAQSNITSVGTLTSLGVNGTVTAVAFTANTGVFTGNGSGLSAIAGANVTGTVANATFATSAGSATTAGTANTTQALTIGTGLGGTSFNGGTAVTITNTGVTSIVAGTNIAISGGTGAVTVNVTGTVANATFATSAGSATTAGTVTTNAQPNITSVGTLTNVTVSGTSNLGAVGNVTITGGSANFILETNGSGVLSWVAKPSGGATITDDTSTNATYYPVYATSTSGTLTTAGITTTKLQFNPSTGEMTATNFNSLSDEKFKTNIKPITDALEIIKKLQGVSYDWIEGGSSHGLIAQSVENIIPNVVSDNGERKTINYSAIIPFLIEAIKTQQELIDSHSLEIDKLKKIIKHILEKIEGL
jgi:hypothetical protein